MHPPQPGLFDLLALLWERGARAQAWEREDREHWHDLIADPLGLREHLLARERARCLDDARLFEMMRQVLMACEGIEDPRAGQSGTP